MPLLFLYKKIVTHCEKAYYIIFEIPCKRPNEQRECDWSNLQTSIFYYGSCDTQSM